MSGISAKIRQGWDDFQAGSKPYVTTVNNGIAGLLKNAVAPLKADTYVGIGNILGTYVAKTHLVIARESDFRTEFPTFYGWTHNPREMHLKELEAAEQTFLNLGLLQTGRVHQWFDSFVMSFVPILPSAVMMAYGIAPIAARGITAEEMFAGTSRMIDGAAKAVMPRPMMGMVTTTGEVVFVPGVAAEEAVAAQAIVRLTPSAALSPVAVPAAMMASNPFNEGDAAENGAGRNGTYDLRIAEFRRMSRINFETLARAKIQGADSFWRKISDDARAARLGHKLEDMFQAKGRNKGSVRIIKPSSEDRALIDVLRERGLYDLSAHASIALKQEAVARNFYERYRILLQRKIPGL